jgi:zinc-binding alcohol dehydrogenase/oxidoreductase
VIAGATAGATPEVNLRRLFWSQISLIGSTMASDADVSNMLRFVSGTKLKPVIDHVYDFDEAPQALARLASGEQFGKLVVRIGEGAS